MKTFCTAITILVSALSGPAAAQGTSSRFALPQGCTAYVTVQKRDCTVSHLFTCEADPEGWQRRVDIGEEGPVYLGVIDSETQWIESHHLSTGVVDRLGDQVEDPASFSELLSTGRDRFVFETVSEPFAVTMFRGSDRLTGRKLVIDGVALKETEFQVIATDPSGEELYRITGNEFINPEWRSFLSGIRRVTSPEDSFKTDASPVTFEFPDEPGFLSTEPRFGCDVVLSALPQSLAATPATVLQ